MSMLFVSTYEPGNLIGSVTGQEQNFVSVHMENFTPINKDEIQETNFRGSLGTFWVILAIDKITINNGV